MLGLSQPVGAEGHFGQVLRIGGAGDQQRRGGRQKVGAFHWSLLVGSFVVKHRLLPRRRTEGADSVVPSFRADACFAGVCARKMGDAETRQCRRAFPVAPARARGNREAKQEARSMLKSLVPATIAPPFARYAHGVAGAGVVVTSGQLALAPDGTVPEGAEAQATMILANIDAILAELGQADDAGAAQVAELQVGEAGGRGEVAASGAAPKPDGGRPFILFADERLLARELEGGGLRIG